ncbi:MAG: uroporphyrinogen-III synthase [Planctomycetota bacterium]
MNTWRLLLTGPTKGLMRWRKALEAIPAYVTESLEIIDRPLIELRALPLGRLGPRPDWLCVTSAMALEALEGRWGALQGTRCAVVGERSADRLRDLGLDVQVGPATSAKALLESWLPQLRPGQRVLWPRGSESDQVARTLRATGAEVDDPIAYDNRATSDRHALPPAELVFFASPSAVEAYLTLERVDPPGPMTAIAIGPTTAAALEALEDSPFAGLEELDEPTPAALIDVLVRLRRDAP